MESKLQKYITASESISREVNQFDIPNQIVQFVAERFSQIFKDKLHYAFIHPGANKIIASTAADSTIQTILPFFLNEKFIEEINRLDWSAIDTRGIRLVLRNAFNQDFDLDTPIVMIPRKKGTLITHFSGVWGASVLKRIDKEEIEFISTVCNAVELRLNSLLSHRSGGGTTADVPDSGGLKTVALDGEVKHFNAASKKDFFGSFLLNMMGETLSRTAVLFLSINENNTEYAPVASRGVQKKLIEKTHITNKNTFVHELVDNRMPLMVSELLILLRDIDIGILKKLEASVLVPLITKRGMMGILTLGERINMTPYTDKVLSTVQMLTKQMALNIENNNSLNFKYSLSRDLSPEVLDELTDHSEIKLEGEIKKVTVLIAGISRFSGIVEKLKPDKVINLLNNYHSGATKIVFKYGGMLDKFIGDRVVSVFGTPNMHYNDTERAVFTAVDMCRFIEDINEKGKTEGSIKINLCVGVSSGEVVSGNMGNVERIDYSVVGRAVDTAFQLERAARKGQILVTRKVYEEVRYLVDAESLGTLTEEATGRPVEIFEIRDLIPYRYISAIEKREPYIIGHFLNIARDVEMIGKKLGLSGKELTRLRLATMLMDVGRIGLPEGIFNKKGKLTSQEFEIVKSHAVRGADQVEKKLNLFREGVELVKHHHEFYDGTGYPEGLKGNEIPLWARIVCVVDSYQAMTENRPFRDPIEEEKAIEIIKEYRGKKYDPEIVDIYLNILNIRIKEKEIVEL
ncbi:MAG TPA: HD domain-containing protein [Spirochaetes bacterium]|nr:HD domain-containing protein [Spirochaetota bacterium]